MVPSMTQEQINRVNEALDEERKRRALEALMAISLPICPAMGMQPAQRQDVTNYYDRKKGGRK